MTRSQEALCLAGLLGVWLALNLITLERSPTVWRDEVMFAEPAVRFLQGHGFTATSWEASPQLPAVFNGPLYSLLLIPWLKVWGIGPVAARSLGLVLGGLASCWLWLLVRRQPLLPSPAWRLVGVAVLLCGFSVAWACRSGRYDALGMLLAMALAGSVGRGWKRATVAEHGISVTRGLSRRDTEILASRGGPDTIGALPPSTSDLQPLPGDALRFSCTSVRSASMGRFPRSAAIATALLAALLPFAGLCLVPYVVLAGVAGFALGGWASWRRFVLPACGLTLGCGLLALLHLGLGTWSAAAAFVAAQTGPSVLGRLGQVPASWCADPSLLPLVAFLACVWLARGLGRRVGATWAVPSLAAGWRRLDPCLIGLAAAVGIPAWMTLAGKYAPYYGWMTFVPVLGCVLCVLDVRVSPGGAGDQTVAPRMAPRPRWLVLTGVAALLAAAVLGLPLRLLACALEWRQRDYAPVARFVQTNLHPDDVVVSGSETYYSATRHCRLVTLPACLWASGSGIPREATALVGGAELVEELGAVEVHGWVPMASYESPRYSLPVRLGQTRWYRLTVWRRPAPGTAPGNQSGAPDTGLRRAPVSGLR